MASDSDLIDGSPSELAYYNIVRTTLHGLDGVRLRAEVSGLTVTTGFIAVALTTMEYVKDMTVMEIKFPLGLILATIFCLISAVVARQFIRKIKMFNFFIAASVNIAETFENKIVRENKKLGMTSRFEEHESAGGKGDPLFLFALNSIQCLAWIGAIISLLSSISYNF